MPAKASIVSATATPTPAAGQACALSKASAGPALTLREDSRRQPRFLARGNVAAAWRARLAPRVIAMLRACDSVVLATADADGHPYVQHRGGPPGWLHVPDDRTLAFADFAGNRQYTTVDNLAENARAFLLFIDYERGHRIKIAGRARVSDDQALIARLTPAGYPADVERAIVFDVDAWSANCAQHIPRRVKASARP